MKERVKQLIAEAFGSDIASSAPLIKYEDNPLTEAIVDFFKDRKDAELVRVQENGDIWLIDVRTTLANVNPQQQYAREDGKTKSYEIKREFDIYITDKFNIPSASISGVRMNANNVCEFEIQFVYANKGNVKVHYESVKNKKKLLESIQADIKDGNEVEVELTNGKIIKGKVIQKGNNSIKVRTDATSTQVIPSGLIKTISKVIKESSELGIPSDAAIDNFFRNYSNLSEGDFFILFLEEFGDRFTEEQHEAGIFNDAVEVAWDRFS